MYLPKHFEETRKENLHSVIRDHPLGVLVLNGPSGLNGNHSPFELNPGERVHGHLHAHVARANPLWQDTKDGDEALVIFRTADAYISPNWYPSKHQYHRQVPTWNYQAVHVHGQIKIRDDERYVRGVVARLTRANEARTRSNKPWKMTDSSKEYIDRMLTAIVGIEIEITKVIGKWKLSQNREEQDRINSAKELLDRDEHIISTAMRDSLIDNK
jgi:transcriptional regulator